MVRACAPWASSTSASAAHNNFLGGERRSRVQVDPAFVLPAAKGTPPIPHLCSRPQLHVRVLSKLPRLRMRTHSRRCAMHRILLALVLLGIALAGVAFYIEFSPLGVLLDARRFGLFSALVASLASAILL